MLVQQQCRPGGNQVGPLAQGFTSRGEPDVLLGPTLKGHVMSRTTVSRVANLEKQQTDVKHRLAEFDSAITARFNDDTHVLVEGGKIQPQDWSEPVDDLDFLDKFHNVVSNPEVPEVDQQFTYLTISI